jgi:hypothetical protein
MGLTRLRNPQVAVTSNTASQLQLDAQATFPPSTTTHSNPTAMSSRRVVKADVDYKGGDNSGPGEDEIVPTPPTRKRKATDDGQKSAPKRRKGKLSKLPDMPLDVLYEVPFGKP